jgi:myo-inositol 2-dehydrogenase/D-chiro-inositol 1-dehydrogenase
MVQAKDVRFGLVGYGAWGACHARAIQREATLTAVCAATPQSRARAAEALGLDVAVCAAYDELLRRPDVDVVDVVVPNHLHRAVAVAALAAGKHVLLEKPMAPTVPDAQAIAAAARQADRLLVIGHEARISPQWGKVKELIDAGAIGQPMTAAIHLWRFPYRLGASGWRYDRERVGSWTLEEPIHYFDLIRWYLGGAGSPQTVVACANSVSAQRPHLYHNLATLVTFPGGVYGTVTQTLAAYEYHLRAEVVGTRGAIRTWWLGEIDRTDKPAFAFEYFDGTRKHEVQLASTPGELFELQTEIGHVARCVAAGQTRITGPATPAPPATLATAEDGLWAVRLCLAAEEAARSGAPVRLDERLDERGDVR